MDIGDWANEEGFEGFPQDLITKARQSDQLLADAMEALNRVYPWVKSHYELIQMGSRPTGCFRDEAVALSQVGFLLGGIIVHRQSCEEMQQ